jgi:uncharacterized protein (DUF362 family)
MSTNRREFLKKAISAATMTVASPLFVFPNRSTASNSYRPTVAVAKGASPSDNTRKAIEALGGIEKFVKPGDRVLLKPNCISSHAPTSAINTNPEVVAEVARLCQKAGARVIYALGHDVPTVWIGNGIGTALQAYGGKIAAANSIDGYISVKLPRGLLLRETMVVKELMEYEVFINLPVAKHHAGSQLTLGMKNYMGLNWDRLTMHRTDLHQCIADLSTVRKAELTVLDATRMLLTNGPGGPGKVRLEDTIIAGGDPVAVDAYGATLFKQEPRKIRHILAGYEMGIGEIDMGKVDVRFVG